MFRYILVIRQNCIYHTFPHFYIVKKTITMNDYLKINKQAWNNKTAVHKNSTFYDMPSFLSGKSSLNKIELDLLGDIKDKSILHLQCHFGQDTISLAKMGAQVTGVDLSNDSIELARKLAEQMKVEAKFICSDIYSFSKIREQSHDIVFTSYGTIIWLPDLDEWAKVIYDSLKEGGELVFADFHPVIWMYDDNVEKLAYPYFNEGPILEVEEGTYADKSSDLKDQMITWNHSLSEMMMALLKVGLTITDFQEYDYAPYHFIPPMKEIDNRVYKLKDIEYNIPLVYSIVAKK